MDVNVEQSMERSILEVAERLFLEKGFDGTSTTQIAKEVGCNQALVHYYFRTKENLFNTIFEKKFSAFFQSVFDTANLSGLTFIEKIRYISESHFDLLLQNPKLPRLILSELSVRPDSLKELKNKLHIIPEKLIAMMQAELQQEIKAGTVRNVDFIDIIIALVSLNVALFTLLPVAGKLLDFDQTIIESLIKHRREENVKVILSYLRP